MASNVQSRLSFRPNLWTSLASWKHPKRALFTKTVTLLVAITFLMPYLGFAFQSGTYPVDAVGAYGYARLAANGAPITIEPEWGRVTSSYQGNSGMTVVYIQDLHCNYEVQDHLRSLVANLSEKNKLQLVGVEGESQPVDVKMLAMVPSEKVRTWLGDYFMRRGRVTGPEFQAAVNRTPIVLQGIETQGLYDASRDLVMGFLNDENQGYCEDIRQVLERLKKPLYNNDLAKMDHEKEAFVEETMTLEKYCDFLLGQASRQGIELGRFPVMKLYALEHKLPVSAAVDYEKLYSDAEDLELAIRATFYTSADQRQLDHYLYLLRITEDLVNISATEKELTYYRSHKQEFAVQNLLNFLEDVCYRYAVEPNLDQGILTLDEAVAQSAKFYEIADRRSDAFVNNLLSAMQDRKQKIAVLITGGYHATGVEDALRKQNISYMTIRPRITRTDAANPYFALLRNQRTPMERLLEQKERLFAPRSSFANNPLFRKYFHTMFNIFDILDNALAGLTGDQLQAKIQEMRSKYADLDPNTQVDFRADLSDPKQQVYIGQFRTGKTGEGNTYIVLRKNDTREMGYQNPLVEEVLGDTGWMFHMVDEQQMYALAKRLGHANAVGAKNPLASLGEIFATAARAPQGLQALALRSGMSAFWAGIRNDDDNFGGTAGATVLAPVFARGMFGAKTEAAMTRALTLFFNTQSANGVTLMDTAANLASAAVKGAFQSVDLTALFGNQAARRTSDARPLLQEKLKGMFSLAKPASRADLQAAQDKLNQLDQGQSVTIEVNGAKVALNKVEIVVMDDLKQIDPEIAKHLTEAGSFFQVKGTTGVIYVMPGVDAGFAAAHEFIENVAGIEHDQVVRMQNQFHRGLANLNKGDLLDKAIAWAKANYDNKEGMQLNGSVLLATEFENVLILAETHPELKSFLKNDPQRLAIAGMAYRNSKDLAVANADVLPSEQVVALATDFNQAEWLAKHITGNPILSAIRSLLGIRGNTDVSKLPQNLVRGNSYLAQLVRAIQEAKANGTQKIKFSMGLEDVYAPERFLNEAFSLAQAQAIAQLARDNGVEVVVNGPIFDNDFLTFRATANYIQQAYKDLLRKAQVMGAQQMVVRTELQADQQNDLKNAANQSKKAQVQVAFGQEQAAPEQRLSPELSKALDRFLEERTQASYEKLPPMGSRDRAILNQLAPDQTVEVQINADSGKRTTKTTTVRELIAELDPAAKVDIRRLTISSITPRSNHTSLESIKSRFEEEDVYKNLEATADNNILELMVVFKSGLAADFAGNKEMLLETVSRDDVDYVTFNHQLSWLKYVNQVPLTNRSADFDPMAELEAKVKPHVRVVTGEELAGNQTIYHGSIKGFEKSIRSGAKNTGKGFGGQGLYLALERELADEYADFAVDAAEARIRNNPEVAADLTGRDARSKIVLEGKLNPNKQLRVAQFTIRRYGAPDLAKGELPGLWADDPLLSKFLNQFDVLDIRGMKDAGLNLNTNRVLVVHENAGADAIQWAEGYSAKKGSEAPKLAFQAAAKSGAASQAQNGFVSLSADELKEVRDAFAERNVVAISMNGTRQTGKALWDGRKINIYPNLFSVAVIGEIMKKSGMTKAQAVAAYADVLYQHEFFHRKVAKATNGYYTSAELDGIYKQLKNQDDEVTQGLLGVIEGVVANFYGYQVNERDDAGQPIFFEEAIANYIESAKAIRLGYAGNYARELNFVLAFNLLLKTMEKKLEGKKDPNSQRLRTFIATVAGLASMQDVYRQSARVSLEGMNDYVRSLQNITAASAADKLTVGFFSEEGGKAVIDYFRPLMGKPVTQKGTMGAQAALGAASDEDFIRAGSVNLADAAAPVRAAVVNQLNASGIEIRADGKGVFNPALLAKKVEAARDRLKAEQAALERKAVKTIADQAALKNFPEALAQLDAIIRSLSQGEHAFTVMLSNGMDARQHGAAEVRGETLFLNAKQAGKFAQKDQFKLMKLMLHEVSHVAGMGNDREGEINASILGRLASGYQMGILDVLNEIRKVDSGSKLVAGAEVASQLAAQGGNQARSAQADKLFQYVLADQVSPEAAKDPAIQEYEKSKAVLQAMTRVTSMGTDAEVTDSKKMSIDEGLRVMAAVKQGLGKVPGQKIIKDLAESTEGLIEYSETDKGFKLYIDNRAETIPERRAKGETEMPSNIEMATSVLKLNSTPEETSLWLRNLHTYLDTVYQSSGKFVGPHFHIGSKTMVDYEDTRSWRMAWEEVEGYVLPILGKILGNVTPALPLKSENANNANFQASQQMGPLGGFTDYVTNGAGRDEENKEKYFNFLVKDGVPEFRMRVPVTDPTQLNQCFILFSAVYIYMQNRVNRTKDSKQGIAEIGEALPFAAYYTDGLNAEAAEKSLGDFVKVLNYIVGEQTGNKSAQFFDEAGVRDFFRSKYMPAVNSVRANAKKDPNFVKAYNLDEKIVNTTVTYPQFLAHFRQMATAFGYSYGKRVAAAGAASVGKVLSKGAKGLRFWSGLSTSVLALSLGLTAGITMVATTGCMHDPVEIEKNLYEEQQTKIDNMVTTMETHYAQLQSVLSAEDRTLVEGILNVLRAHRPVYDPNYNYPHSNASTGLIAIDEGSLASDEKLESALIHEALHLYYSTLGLNLSNEEQVKEISTAEDVWQWLSPGEEGWVIQKTNIATHFFQDYKLGDNGEILTRQPETPAQPGAGEAVFSIDGTRLTVQQMIDRVKDESLVAEKRLFTLKALPLLAIDKLQLAFPGASAATSDRVVAGNSLNELKRYYEAKASQYLSDIQALNPAFAGTAAEIQAAFNAYHNNPNGMTAEQKAIVNWYNSQRLVDMAAKSGALMDMNQSFQGAATAAVDMSAIEAAAQPFTSANTEMRAKLEKVLKAAGVTILPNGQGRIDTQSLIDKINTVLDRINREKADLEKKARPTQQDAETLLNAGKASEQLHLLIRQLGGAGVRTFNLFISTGMDSRLHGVAEVDGENIYLNANQVEKFGERDQLKLMKLVMHEISHVSGMADDREGEIGAYILGRLASGYQMGTLDVVKEIQKVDSGAKLVNASGQVQQLAAMGAQPVASNGPEVQLSEFQQKRLQELTEGRSALSLEQKQLLRQLNDQQTVAVTVTDQSGRQRSANINVAATISRLADPDVKTLKITAISAAENESDLRNVEGKFSQDLEIANYPSDHVFQTIVVFASGITGRFIGNKQMLRALAERSDVARIQANADLGWVPFVGDVPVEQRTAEYADVWMAKLEQQLKPATSYRATGDQLTDGKPVYHGTKKAFAASVYAGPRNVGTGFGGRGLYIAMEKSAAEEYAPKVSVEKIVNQTLRTGRSLDVQGGVAAAAQPVVLEGRLNPEQQFRVLRLHIHRGGSADITKGILPGNWEKDPMLVAFVEKYFDVVEVLGAASAGTAMPIDRALTVQERAGKNAILWDQAKEETVGAKMTDQQKAALDQKQFFAQQKQLLDELDAAADRLADALDAQPEAKAAGETLTAMLRIITPRITEQRLWTDQEFQSVMRKAAAQYPALVASLEQQVGAFRANNLDAAMAAFKQSLADLQGSWQARYATQAGSGVRMAFMGAKGMSAGKVLSRGVKGLRYWGTLTTSMLALSLGLTAGITMITASGCTHDPVGIEENLYEEQQAKIDNMVTTMQMHYAQIQSVLSAEDKTLVEGLLEVLRTHRPVYDPNATAPSSNANTGVITIDEGSLASNEKLETALINQGLRLYYASLGLNLSTTETVSVISTAYDVWQWLLPGEEGWIAAKTDVATHFFLDYSIGANGEIVEQTETPTLPGAGDPVFTIDGAKLTVQQIIDRVKDESLTVEKRLYALKVLPLLAFDGLKLAVADASAAASDRVVAGNSLNTLKRYYEAKTEQYLSDIQALNSSFTGTNAEIQAALDAYNNNPSGMTTEQKAIVNWYNSKKLVDMAGKSQDLLDANQSFQGAASADVDVKAIQAEAKPLASVSPEVRAKLEKVLKAAGITVLPNGQGRLDTQNLVDMINATLDRVNREKAELEKKARPTQQDAEVLLNAGKAIDQLRQLIRQLGAPGVRTFNLFTSAAMDPKLHGMAEVDGVNIYLNANQVDRYGERDQLKLMKLVMHEISHVSGMADDREGEIGAYILGRMASGYQMSTMDVIREIAKVDTGQKLVAGKEAEVRVAAMGAKDANTESEESSDEKKGFIIGQTFTFEAAGQKHSFKFRNLNYFRNRTMIDVTVDDEIVPMETSVVFGLFLWSILKEAFPELEAPTAKDCRLLDGGPIKGMRPFLVNYVKKSLNQEVPVEQMMDIISRSWEQKYGTDFGLARQFQQHQAPNYTFTVDGKAIPVVWVNVSAAHRKKIEKILSQSGALDESLKKIFGTGLPETSSMDDHLLISYLDEGAEKIAFLVNLQTLHGYRPMVLKVIKNSDRTQIDRAFETYDQLEAKLPSRGMRMGAKGEDWFLEEYFQGDKITSWQDTIVDNPDATPAEKAQLQAAIVAVVSEYMMLVKIGATIQDPTLKNYLVKKLSSEGKTKWISRLVDSTTLEFKPMTPEQHLYRLYGNFLKGWKANPKIGKDSRDERIPYEMIFQGVVEAWGQEGIRYLETARDNLEAMRASNQLYDRFKKMLDSLTPFLEKQKAPASETAATAGLQVGVQGRLTLAQDSISFQKADPKAVLRGEQSFVSELNETVGLKVDIRDSNIQLKNPKQAASSSAFVTAEGTPAIRVATGEQVTVTVPQGKKITLGSMDYYSCAAAVIRGVDAQGNKVLTLAHLEADNAVSQMDRAKMLLDQLRGQQVKNLEIYMVIDPLALGMRPDDTWPAAFYTFPNALSDIQKQLGSDVKLLGIDQKPMDAKGDAVRMNIYATGEGVVVDYPTLPGTKATASTWSELASKQLAASIRDKGFLASNIIADAISYLHYDLGYNVPRDGGMIGDALISIELEKVLNLSKENLELALFIGRDPERLALALLTYHSARRGESDVDPEERLLSVTQDYWNSERLADAYLDVALGHHVVQWFTKMPGSSNLAELPSYLKKGNSAIARLIRFVEKNPNREVYFNLNAKDVLNPERQLPAYFSDRQIRALKELAASTNVRIALTGLVFNPMLGFNARPEMIAAYYQKLIALALKMDAKAITVPMTDPSMEAVVAEIRQAGLQALSVDGKPWTAKSEGTPQAGETKRPEQGFYGDRTQQALANLLEAFLQTRPEIATALQETLGTPAVLTAGVIFAQSLVPKIFQAMTAEQQTAFFGWFGKDVKLMDTKRASGLLSHALDKAGRVLADTLHRSALNNASGLLRKLQQGEGIAVEYDGATRPITKLEVRRVSTRDAGPLSEHVRSVGAFFTVEGATGVIHVLDTVNLEEAVLHEFVEYVAGETHGQVVALQAMAAARQNQLASLARLGNLARSVRGFLTNLASGRAWTMAGQSLSLSLATASNLVDGAYHAGSILSARMAQSTLSEMPEAVRARTEIAANATETADTLAGALSQQMQLEGKPQKESRPYIAALENIRQSGLGRLVNRAISLPSGLRMMLILGSTKLGRTADLLAVGTLIAAWAGIGMLLGGSMGVGLAFQALGLGLASFLPAKYVAYRLNGTLVSPVAQAVRERTMQQDLAKLQAENRLDSKTRLLLGMDLLMVLEQVKQDAVATQEVVESLSALAVGLSDTEKTTRYMEIQSGREVKITIPLVLARRLALFGNKWGMPLFDEKHVPVRTSPVYKTVANAA